jgi:hypothetical protein
VGPSWHSLSRRRRSRVYDARSLAITGARLGCKAGTFIYEPAGEAHTLVITDDSPEPALIVFIVERVLVYLDASVNGGFAAYEDGFTILELTRK